VYRWKLIFPKQFQPMTELAIQAHNLDKTFGKVRAVRGLNLEVPRSRIYGFLGPNGSGKTTAIRMLCGLLTPTAGDINVLGYSIPDEAEALRLKVGYMTQKFSLFGDLTVGENLQFMADIYTLDRKLKPQRIGLAVERYELDRIVNQRAGTLSGGQKQRLALAASTLHGPELLFLDEPTSAVDPENRRSFWEALYDLVAEGTTILVSTHYMDEAERCHALAILDEGALVAEGSPEDLQKGIDASIVTVESDQPRKVGKMLEQQPFVHSSAQVGNILRVMVSIDQASPDKAVSDVIRREGLSLKHCNIARPGLEDVFVAATRSRKEVA
jgi:ABC-2 type transport system ATP-binding protein